MLLEHLARDQGHVDDLPPLHAWHRVEVDAQFVWMREIVGAYRVRIEVDAAHVDRPHQAGGIVDDGLLGRGARRVLQLGDVDEVRPLLRCPLLEDCFLGNALDEPLEDHRPVPHTAQRPLGDIGVIEHQVHLGGPDIGEDYLVGIGDGQLPTVDLQVHRTGHTVMLICRPQ